MGYVASEDWRRTMRRFPVVVVMAFSAIVSCLSIASAAQAQTVLFVDDDAPTGGDGLSWATAYRFLQDALTDARRFGGASEIHVAQGRYTPDRGAGFVIGDRGASFELISGVALMGGYAGVNAVDPDARDIALFETILSGDLAGDDESPVGTPFENSSMIVTITNLIDEAILDGFTITNGSMRTFTTFTTSDQGVLVVNASCAIRSCTFKYCSSSMGGGAIRINSGSPATQSNAVSIHSCTFQHNRAAFGGAISIFENAFNNLPLTFLKVIVDASIFTDNRARIFDPNSLIMGVGGAIEISTVVRSPVKLQNCLFSSNMCDVAGGAIHSVGPVNVTKCSFVNNAAASDHNTFGGAVYGEGQMQIKHCIFIGNLASSRFFNTASGGAIALNSAPGTPRHVVDNTLFVGNSGVNGGAITMMSSSTGDIETCTFFFNTSSQSGGAILFNPSSPVDPLLIRNTISWSNFPTEVYIPNTAGITADIRSTLIRGGFPGVGNIDADPLFVDPFGPDGFAGTLDDDLRLSPGSPAIDAGDSTLADQSFCATDLDGNQRIFDDSSTPDTGMGTPAVVDMGAYEFAAPPPIPCPGDLDGDCTTGPSDLLLLLSVWGKASLTIDPDGSGSVGPGDLLLMLAAWGACR